jgi:hypothetical protein
MIEEITVEIQNAPTIEVTAAILTGPAGTNGEAYQSATAPDPAEHPLWYDLTDGSLNQWHGTPPEGVWVNVSHEEDPQVPSVATFAAVGDSITDRSTLSNNPAGRVSINFDQRGWAAVLEQIANRQVVGLGPPAANTYKVGTLIDRDHGYSGITAYTYLNGGVVYGDLIPIDDAIDADPDFFIVHIGTNDVPDQDAATTIARVRAVWAALVATGKPVIGTDILQRASSQNSTTTSDKIIAINTALRLSWEADGLWTYRQWDDLITKDGSGYADEVWYPDNDNIGNPDGIHPGTALAYLMADDLKTFLADKWTGTPPTIPANGSASWVTPNAYVAGSVAGLASGWANNYLNNVGTDTIFSKVSDAEGDWQRVEIVTETDSPSSSATNGVYDRLTGAGVTALIGTQIRPTARIRIPAGQNLAGVGISVQCVGATGVEDWTYNAWCPYQTTVSPISEFDATIYCDPFVVPAGTTQIWILITPGRGTGIFEFQKAGILKA